MPLSKLVTDVSKALETKGWMIATAESCTGGLIAKLLTDRAGSSTIFERGFVTYSNEAKMDLLRVKLGTLQQYGAVSAETAIEMAIGALHHSKAHIALSVTGIAGPGGGTEEKPVGTIYIGLATAKTHDVQRCLFSGSREDIRTQTAQKALEWIIRTIELTKVSADLQENRL